MRQEVIVLLDLAHPKRDKYATASTPQTRTRHLIRDSDVDPPRLLQQRTCVAALGQLIVLFQQDKREKRFGGGGGDGREGDRETARPVRARRLRGLFAPAGRPTGLAVYTGASSSPSSLLLTRLKNTEARMRDRQVRERTARALERADLLERPVRRRLLRVYHQPARCLVQVGIYF